MANRFSKLSSLDTFTSETSSRRSLMKAAALGGAAALLPSAFSRAPVSAARKRGKAFQNSSLAVEIEQIIQAPGNMAEGVLNIEIDRNDLTAEYLHGVHILPSFEVNGNLFFQFLYDGNGDADDSNPNMVIMNGDLAFTATEIDPAIDQMIANNIIFQAEHQHFYDLRPIIFFMHFRAVGDGIQIAKGLKKVLNVTSTPFPQTAPSNPTTPLPVDELGKILGGVPSIGSDGVVTVLIPRADQIVLGGIEINPFLNVMTPVAFQPWGGGTNAAVASDFGMVASEIQGVVSLMRGFNWDVGCLYNQETDEQPQLYFSHMFNTGDSVTLAKQVRMGLNKMNMAFTQ